VSLKLSHYDEKLKITAIINSAEYGEEDAGSKCAVG
jgi:hypothetical protein